MKKIATFLFSLSLYFANAQNGEVLLSDNFANGSAWNVTQGDFIVSNNIVTTEGSNGDFTFAFRNLSRPLAAGDKLQLTFKSNEVTNFLTTGWAGVSFYAGGDEEIYIGSLGNTPSWGIDGPSMGGPTQINWPSAIAEVKFTYDYDSGDWTLRIGNQTASGTINSNINLDEVRIAADIQNYADIAVSNLNVVVNSGTDVQALSTCPPYTWINANTYNNNTFIQVHTLPGAAMGGADSIVTLDLSFATTFPIGEGTPSNPYQINSKNDLKILSENSCFWNMHFILMTDIVFNSTDFEPGEDFDNGGQGFLPIGNQTTQFSGTFNGNEHTISNLYINTSQQYAGLFGYTAITSNIMKLNVENAEVFGTHTTGALVGQNTGVIFQCNTSGTISEDYKSGGLAGGNSGTISNCYSFATIGSGLRIAGNNRVKKTGTNNQVNGSGGKGGLVGETGGGSITNSYAAGSLSSIVGAPKGGLIGAGSGTVNNCFWDTQATGLMTSGGGAGAMGKTTLEMTTKSTYTNATWDFVTETVNGTNDIWQMNGCTNNGYPVFSWQPLNQPSVSYNSYSHCSTATINGNVYTSSQIVNDTLVGQAVSGCDSIVITYLYIDPSYATYGSIDTTLCTGQTLTVGSYIHTMSGSYTDTLVGAGGCDSIVDVILTIYSSNIPSLVVTEIPTLNIAQGGTASASDTYSANDPAEAFDGEFDYLGWGNEGNGFPSWLEYDYGTGNGKIVKNYSFFCSSNMNGGWSDPYYNPSEWNFQGFDGTNWVNLDTVIDLNPTQDVWYNYTINNNTSYEKYRMYITNSWDGDYAMITELRFLEFDSCANKSFTFKPNDLASNSITSFQWDVNGVPVGLTGQETIDLASFELGDTVRCSIVINNTCASTTTASNYTTIQTGPVTATATVSTTGEVLTAHPAGATYQWFNCDTNSPISGETNQTFTATVNGNYSVIVTSGTCSVDTSDCIAVNTVGLTNNVFQSAIKLFPNPNNGNFSIDLGSREENITITVSDVLGKTISVENYSRTKNLNISLDEPAGVYFITINNNRNKYARLKVVKQ